MLTGTPFDQSLGLVEKITMNTWYLELQRPPLTPPSWVFGPVWSVLYVMIAVSIFLYVKQTWKSPHYWAYALICLHLTTNFAWTPIFFGAQRPGYALLDIILLDISLVLIIAHFWYTYKPSSVLLFPYLVWVLFATYLNAGFFVMNTS